MSSEEKEAKSSHTARMIWNAENGPVVERVERTLRTASKWRILVVENDLKTRSDYVQNLERWGYQVFAAAPKEEPKETLLENARKLAKRERCQLALVDMRLLSDDDDSDISGLNLVPDLKPTESIVVTGYADRPFYSRQAAERGVLAVFGKEEGPEVLQKAVEDALADLGDPYPDSTALGEYATSHPWRVLVTGNDERERSYYVDLLKLLGYQVCEASRKDAAHVAKKHRCHLVLVDADADPRVDSDDIEELRPAETIVIGRSSAFLALRETMPEAIPTIRKRAGAEKLCERIQAVLKDSGYREIDITWPDELNAIRVARHIFRDNPAQFEEEAKDILRRLFRSAKSLRVVLLDPDKNTPSVTLKPRSLVVRVKQDDQLRSYFVKIGRESKTKREMENYEGVSGFFTANPYIRPIVTFRFWNLGGTVYDFAGDYDDLDFKLFSEYYLAKEEIADISEALDSHLKLWSDLYHRRAADRTVSEAYGKVWGTGWHEALKDHYRRVWGSERRSGTRLCGEFATPEISTALALSNPVRWLIDKLFDPDGQYRDTKTPETQVARTHGDFHADNFFVTKNHNVCPIDFERAGDGPVLQDWIELEHDIITRLLFSHPGTWRPMQQVEWQLFARLVCVVAQPKGVEGFARIDDNTHLRDRIGEPRVDKALDVIDRIRLLAKRSDEKASKDARAYLWGLLLNAVYRLVNWCEEYEEDRLDEESPEEYEMRRLKLLEGIQRCYVLAGILCHRLDNWGADVWPPKEWKSGRLASQSIFDPGKHVNPESSSLCYALLIGVGNTPNDPPLSLPTTVSDAQALQLILVDPTTCAYPPENVRMLYNETATLSRILDGLKWLADKTTANPDSTAIVYFSGHGGHLQTDDRYFLVPSNIDPGNLAGTVLWASEFTDQLRAIKAKRAVVLVDACHAAKMATTKDVGLLQASGFVAVAPPKDQMRFWDLVPSKKPRKSASTPQTPGEGRAIISSSGGDQSSFVRKDGTLSIFTYHLREVLRGDASKSDDRCVRVSTLMYHLGKSVPASAKADWDAEQVPWTELSSQDFCVVQLGNGHRHSRSQPLPVGSSRLVTMLNADSVSKAARPLRVFYAYCHRDEQMLEQLKAHLAGLRRQGYIVDWYDRNITAGTEWEGAIEERLNTADIILLLITAGFLNSDYCYDEEMKRALERHGAGDARVIPVFLRPVEWKGSPFEGLQGLPKDAKPITKWPDRDAAFQDVALASCQVV